MEDSILASYTALLLGIVAERNHVSQHIIISVKFYFLRALYDVKLVYFVG